MRRVRLYLIEGIPEYVRIPLTILSVLGGGYFHMVAGKFLPGILLLLFAILLNWIRGYELNIDEDSLRSTSWKDVTMKEFAKLYEKLNTIKVWNRGSTRERLWKVIVFTLLFIIFLIVFTVQTELYMVFLDRRILSLLLDIYLFVVYFYVSGARKIEIPHFLDIKVRTLSHAIRYLEKKYRLYRIIPVFRIGEHVRGDIPVDVRLKVLPPRMPDFLYQIQFQVSINTVNNRNYPYFYGVIVAKPDFDFKGKISRRIDVLTEIKMEFQKTEEANVCVIRQYTSKSSGYYTREDAVEDIIDVVISKTEELLE